MLERRQRISPETSQARFESSEMVPLDSFGSPEDVKWAFEETSTEK